MYTKFDFILIYDTEQQTKIMLPSFPVYLLAATIGDPATTKWQVVNMVTFLKLPVYCKYNNV